MAVPFWQPGTLIQPGDLRRPTSAGQVVQTGITNADFEDGNTEWTFDVDPNTSAAIEQAPPTFNGTWRLRANDVGHGGTAFYNVVNDDPLPIQPGTPLSVSAFVRCGQFPDRTSIRIFIQWYNATMQPLAASYSSSGTGTASGFFGATRGLEANNVWKQVTVGAIAPPGAAFWAAGVQFIWHPDGLWYVDAFSSDYTVQEQPNPFIFRAVQAVAGYTGNTEPEWPTVLGQTVVDNEVTWEAVAADNVTWEANRILVSGLAEPDFPTTVNGSVSDGSIVWVLDPLRVTDSRVPQSKLAAIAASKVFTANGDISPFCATNNPLDWSTRDDAGYIPFGLQTYGANPITAIGLYRGNLVLSNSVGTQLWQVDPDPAAMSLLDAIPIGCTFPKTMQPIGNDLAFLTEIGVRNMGTVGPAVNLQAGYFGQPIDELVIEAIKQARYEGREPISVYWPAAGQYWLIFGTEVFVLTVHDGEQRSWSRYVFPAAIDYVTVLGEELYLRAGDLVWLVSDEAATDDTDLGEGAGGDDIEFDMVLQWPHLDLGSFGREKTLFGFDLVGSGEVEVSIGYNQRSPDYDPVSGPWTEPYTIDDADTLPGDVVPLPVGGPSFALRLAFTGGELKREFIAANLYVNDLRTGS